MIRYSGEGDINWTAFNTGGGGPEGGHSVITNAAGECFVTGLFASPSLTFTRSVNNAGTGTQDVFVLKLNATSGATLALSAGGGASDDATYGVG